MRTIRQQLLLWLLGGMLLATVIAGFAMYLKVSEEAYELFDYQLQQLALTLPSQLVAQETAKIRADSFHSEQDILLQIWSGDGKQVYASHASRQLPMTTRKGFSTVTALGDQWRVFVDKRNDQVIQVAQSVSTRKDLVFEAAIHWLLPFLVLIPVLAIIVSVAVSRTLKPLRQLASAVERRSASALLPLSTMGIPPDIRPMVDALNDLLKRLDKSLTYQRAFVADASHELRSPLTALKLQLQLAERASSNEERADTFRKLHERLDRSIHLVQQLLTLAHHEPGISDAVYETVNLNKLAHEQVSELMPLGMSKLIDLTIKETSSDVTVSGQYDWLTILLRNLVDNALRYTPQHGSVEVQISVDQGRPTLKVSDTGPGIPTEDYERVFDRFYRRSGTESTGSGLGLSIVKSIAEQHGAQIELSSNANQQGLVVSVYFPVV